MKTENQIIEEIKFLKSETNKKGDLKPNTKKIKVLVELIKIVKFLPEEKVKEQLQILIEDLKKRNDLFPEFYERFSDFRLLDSDSNKKAIRKRFDFEFNVKEKKDRIKSLTYLLEK